MTDRRAFIVDDLNALTAKKSAALTSFHGQNNCLIYSLIFSCSKFAAAPLNNLLLAIALIRSLAILCLPFQGAFNDSY
jgi:hypothetical protein